MENSFNFTTWFTEEEAKFLEDWYNEDMKYIKQWMRENNCLVYTDYSMAALRGGLPIIYVAKPEDLYTEEELLKKKFNDSIKEMEKNCTIKLHKYEKYLNIHKSPYKIVEVK